MTQDTQIVHHTVMAFLDAYAKGSIDECMSLIAQNSPILIFGTNLDEVCKSREEVQAALQRDIANMSNVRWGDARHVQITQDASCANVLLELPLTYETCGKEERVVFRYALSLTRESGQWKITTGMASVPASKGSYSFS